MKQSFKVVMLPTDQSGIGYITLYHKKFPYDFDLIPQINKLGITVNNTQGGLNYDDYYKNQHLYIISDDQVKDNDWVIMDNRWVVQLYDIENGYAGIKDDVGSIHISNCKKIVATTDDSLCSPVGILTNNFGNFPAKKQISQIPESFIQGYIKSYNDGKIITEVDIIEGLNLPNK